MPSCYLCGAKGSKTNTLHKLDCEENICSKCMRQGRTKDALDLLEHNRKADGINARKEPNQRTT